MSTYHKELFGADTATALLGTEAPIYTMDTGNRSSSRFSNTGFEGRQLDASKAHLCASRPAQRYAPPFARIMGYSKVVLLTTSAAIVYNL